MAAMVPPTLALGIGWGTAALLEFDTFADSLTGAIVARSFLNHADLFALGMALAVLHVLVVREEVELPKLWRPTTFAALVGVVGATLFLVDRGIIFRYQGAPIYEGLTSIACALLLAIVVLPEGWDRPVATVRILQSRALVAAGLASYSLFLWHEPIVRWLNREGFTLAGSNGFWLNLMLTAVVAGALSAGTYLLVERPALARKAVRLPETDIVARSQPVLVSSGEVSP
jgi:peptidoglycan/LPS O-acetylase OafA/YrhL